MVLTPVDGRLQARGTGNQSSGILRSMVEADGLAVLPPHASYQPGDSIEVIPLEPFLR